MSSIHKELTELAIKMGAPVVGHNVSEQIRAINVHLGGTSHGANISERIDEFKKVYNSGDGGGTLIEKNVTENGTYDAAEDSADGYSSVTVNVPQPTVTALSAAADLTGYETGDTDLGGGFTITNSTGITGVGSVTVDSATYNGLEMSNAATFKTIQTLGREYFIVEFDMVITELPGNDAIRIVSTGGTIFDASVYFASGGSAFQYLCIVKSNNGIILDNGLSRVSDYNYYDPSISRDDIANSLFVIKYIFDGIYIILNINGVNKIKWPASTLNDIIQTYGLNVGGNGLRTATMLVTKAEYTGETLSWDGNTWIKKEA